MAPVVKITYPPELPVSARREDIAAAIRDHQVVIIAGETGSGKTTQLPKICLELGRGAGSAGGGKLIGHTQPRRIAARSVAERIAEELGTELGDVVGYQVRFTDRTSKASRVKLMTDGILLAELQRDRDLRKYDTIIIDEAHERSLNIDFLLGYLKRLLPRRPDLKLIITSATIDVDRFAEHFGDGQSRAPVVEVSGRTYPVDIRYRPLLELPEDDEEGEPVQRDQTEAIIDAVRELSQDGPGDVLVFLPGEREIRDTADAFEALKSDRLEIVPLYSRLSAADQHKVFSSHPTIVRRVVLATNVAETSLTVPGIRYVVDTGVARISRYSVRTKVQRLPIEPISQASANQRSGRCGRVAEGIAIRLYSEEDFEARPEFTDPEILRTNLASVILQMASLRLGDIARFPFVEPPDRRNIKAGTDLLEELGAVALSSALDQRGQGVRLTKVGQRLARLPIDPRLGRMILEAERLGCLRDVLTIAAALSIQDPRERPEEQRPQADQLHARFTHESSDFLTWLNLWRHIKEQQRELSSSAFRRMCKREFLNYMRIREWQDYESQLRQVAKEMGLDTRGSGLTAHSTTESDGGGAPFDEDGIHQALLSGLLSHVGALEERDTKSKPGERRPMREYVGARNARFAVFPGSVLKGRNPPFLMSAELVETSRLWARQNAAIKPEWAETLGAHLVKRTYSEPHWSRKRAAVMARERVTLYGVPLVADRLVQYGKVDPPLARELFIRHALVQGEWDSRHRFLAENARLLEEAEELEHRARRRDIVVDEQTLFDFYDARVGDAVVSGQHFDQWWKRARQERGDLLTFDPSMLTHDTADQVRANDFPTQWHDSDEAGLTFPISYHFEPGAADDGLTIDVPVATLNRIDADDFSWLVPGLREELVTELIRSLPKSLRVAMVPAPNTAREFLAATPPGAEPLLDALERFARSTRSLMIDREAWDWTKVPEHLRPTYRVLTEEGAEAGRGKDLDALKEPLRPTFEQAMADVAADSGVTATGQTSWTFGTVEESFVQRRAGHEVRGFPALVDEGATVGLQVLATPTEAAAHHRLGVRRLVLLALGPPAAVDDVLAAAGLDQRAKLALVGSPYSSVGELLADLRAGLVGEAVDARPTVRDETSYAAVVAAARDAVAAGLSAAVHDVMQVLDAWRATDKALSGRADLMTLPALTDMRAQVGRLMAPGFIGDAGTTRLRDYPRYLAAVTHRRERLDAQVAKDRQQMDQLAGLQEAWLHAVAALPDGQAVPQHLREARWMLEEYRVSLFAQQLGTREKVSDQRIRRVMGAAP
ncbi:ATP-dependent helicase HrpA [Nocardioides alpinus]|uniref:ATP-dependent RNA helicase HrpA n=1 Tax=Nocardioides alpinus TaxID=748909 RepID=A0A1I0VUY1_9ACTN|nr:ATP-dependent RNA helicase HrpA [Nocardioides alpinus]PKH37497.1 ATP-dependent RNA helicase HrpA [Nocardioides alpinus]SFA80132.1 ATP-dependent helicase HrpA [Nocardioides alpinus]